MVQIIKKNYSQYSAWDSEVRPYTDYYLVIGGHVSYFHRIDRMSKRNDILSRHEMAVKLSYLRMTGYKYVDMNVKAKPYITIEERIDFIRKNHYTPCKTVGALLEWSSGCNCWVFFGNLKECSYVWRYLIYSKDIVDYILEQVKTLPKEWETMIVNI